MEKLSYNKAYKELQEIYTDLREGKISIDKMQNKLARAQELLLYCRKSLRRTEDSIQSLLEEE